MQLYDIAQIQKRVQGWAKFVETEVKDPQLKQRFNSKLMLLKTTLAQYSTNNDKQNLYKITDLVRELEDAHEEARLHVGPN